MNMQIDITDALAGLTDYGEKTLACLRRVGSAAAEDIENYAKLNRPWVDRTGNARRTMKGVCRISGNILTVGVVGRMPYSVYLELGYGGKYSVLAPSVRHFAPEVLQSFARGMSRMNRGGA